MEVLQQPVSKRHLFLGLSGNPFGRPRGIRNKTTIAAEALFEGICRKAIEEAKRGNIQAIKPAH